MKELRCLYDKYSDDSEIVVFLACGLCALIDIQEEKEAKKTLLEMFALAENHINNLEVQEYLEDAKNAFAFDYEDAVFWKTQDDIEEIHTNNCFAVIDTETTWNGDVIFIESGMKSIVILNKEVMWKEI